MAGHGAQKLFGAFGGYGLQGTAGWMESIGLRPGKPWARAAGVSEFGGGLLTALGLFHPLGPIAILSAMTMATVKVHSGKPIWVTEGGAELPVVNSAIALALMLVSPGRYSVDRALGIRLPWPVTMIALTAAAAAVFQGATTETPEEPVQQEAHDALQSEGSPAVS
jgi:putative oxidoreductase